MSQSGTDTDHDLDQRDDLRLADLPLSAEESARSELVDFTVDREAEVPLGTQLDWKLRAMLARGALRSGDRLPSVRELATFSDVNVNTARSVYGELADAGLIATEHGRGTFVTTKADALASAGEAIGAALEAAERAGLPSRELAGLLYASGSEQQAPASPLSSAPATATPAELRRELRRQIAHLEAELSGHAWHDRRTDPDQRRPIVGGPVGRIADVEELERTRDALVERLSRLREDAQRRGAQQQEARTYVERMLTDPSGHRWEIVTSDEVGDDGCKSWRVVPRFGPVGAIMGWWRVKVSSGCPLARPLAAA